MLTKEDANNIVTSWESLAGKELQTMMTFYNALFKVAPEIKFYFPDDMNALSKKLQMTFDIVIENIHNIDELVPELHRLGRFHKHKLGVEPTYYPYVIKAMLLTIKQAMGNQYKTEIGDSWKKMLVFISKHMLAAPPKADNVVVKFFKKVFST